MSDNDGSDKWWQLPTYVIEPLTYVLGGGVLVSVLISLALGRWGVIPDTDATFYVTEIAVPLLTFTGFLAVYLGFRSQEEQNELQEEQLRKQQDNFQKDRFESTFFQLLRTHNQIVNDIRIEQKRKTVEQTEPPHPDIPKFVDLTETTEPVENIPIRGRSCFKHFYEKLEEVFWSASENKNWDDSDKTDVAKIRSVYEIWFRERESQLNHYFSHLSKLISFVDRSEVADNAFYMELISAQMSAPELKLFFYHVTLMKGKSGHRYLSSTEEILEEYSFFERLDRRSLIYELHRRLNKAALDME